MRRSTVIYDTVYWTIHCHLAARRSWVQIPLFCVEVACAPLKTRLGSPVLFTDEWHVLKECFSPQAVEVRWSPNTLVTRNRRVNIKSGKLFNTGKTALRVHGTFSALQPVPAFDDLFTRFNLRLENQRRAWFPSWPGERTLPSAVKTCQSTTGWG